MNDAELRSALLNEFNLEIGAGLGELAGNTWRIGLMGHASSERNVIYCLQSLEAILLRQGVCVHHGKALPAAHAALTADPHSIT